MDNSVLWQPLIGSGRSPAVGLCKFLKPVVRQPEVTPIKTKSTAKGFFSVKNIP